MSKISSKLLKSLQLSPENRSKEDIERISSFLTQVTELLDCDNNDRLLCSHIIHFEIFRKNDIIFKKSDRISQWYYIVYGLAIVGSEMFVSHKSFGCRDELTKLRTSDCVVLEETAVIMFPYEDCNHEKYPCICLDGKSKSNFQPESNFTNKVLSKSQPLSDTSSSGYSGSDRVSTGGGDCESVNWQIGHDFNNNSIFRQSNGSSSQRTTDPIGIDSDSDDDNFSDLTFNEVYCQDAIKEILMKPAKDRTSQEFETLMSIIHNIPIFSLWPQSLRKAACKLARLQIIEHANSILIQKGQSLSDWGYCLQGTLEVRRSVSSMSTSFIGTNQPTGEADSHNQCLGDVLETLRYSDSFGADLRLSNKQVSQFFLVTASDDCWLMLINLDEFLAAKAMEPTTLSQVIEQNKTVVVMEHRTASDGVTQGNVLVKATTKKLIEYLFESHSPAEQNFIEDFFLTYNIHLDTTLQVRNSIIDNLQHRSPIKRHRCIEIVVKWINNHFSEIEKQPDILKFIDLVVLMLLREGEKDGGHRIYSACSNNSNQRTVTLVCNDRDNKTKPIFVGNGSRLSIRESIKYAMKEDYPNELNRLLPALIKDSNNDINSIRLNGLYIRHSSLTLGLNDQTNYLRPGDRLLYLNSTPEEYLSQQQTNNIISKSQLCTFVVKYDPEGFYKPFFGNDINQDLKFNTSIERSNSIHSGLSDLSCQTESDIIGYSTLPLKPKQNSTHSSKNESVTLTRTPTTQAANTLLKKASANNTNSISTNQSALKKMMKRCKANNSFTTDESGGSSINSINSHFSGKKYSVQSQQQQHQQQQLAKCRSAHTSPNRGNNNLINNQFHTGSRTNSATGDRSGLATGSHQNQHQQQQQPHLMTLQQPVKMRKTPRSRCGSQPDLRQLVATSNPELARNQWNSHIASESVIKVHFKETQGDNQSTGLDTNGLNVGGIGSNATSMLSTKSGSSRYCYLLISSETETIEVILKCINELNLACNSSDDFVLVEVTVEPGTMLKQKIIKHNISNLAAMIKLNNRLYLKRRDFSGQLLDNSDIEEIESEMNRAFINLSLSELAVQIFLETYKTFKSVTASEILDFVTNKSRVESNPSSSTVSKDTGDDKKSLHNSNIHNRFQEYMRLGEKYMYFAVNIVCGEYTSCNRRSKILKKLIHLARLCKELGNIEIFFSLMNGLDRIEVTRLRQTWDRLSTKTQKMYRQMQSLLDVSGNMRLLRSLHRNLNTTTTTTNTNNNTSSTSEKNSRLTVNSHSSNRSISSTNIVIPMAALITKDLTTVHEVHPTRVPADNADTINGKGSNSSRGMTHSPDSLQQTQLINFDKLRIMVGLVRGFRNSIYGCSNYKLEIYHSESCKTLPDDETMQIEILRNRITAIENKEGSKSMTKSQTNLNKRISMNVNFKKLYERELERLRVKHFLQKFDKIDKEDTQLLSLSYKCESRSDHGGVTPSIGRSIFNTSSNSTNISISNSGNNTLGERDNNVSIRLSTSGSISSKESSQNSTIINELDTSHSSNSRMLERTSVNSTNSSSSTVPNQIQLQYLEPSRRHIAPPPPYGSHSSIGNPPIPPRRRSSVTQTSADVSKSSLDKNKAFNTVSSSSLSKANRIRYL